MLLCVNKAKLLVSHIYVAKLTSDRASAVQNEIKTNTQEQL